MTEVEMINGCIKKDATCQRLLFEVYAGRLMTVCLRYASNREQAEDMLQETFIRVFKYIHQYRFGGSFEGWLKRTAANCALKMLQKKTLHFFEIEHDLQTASPANISAVTNLSEIELLKLISGLPDGYRIVFNLYAIEGYSHDEIAKLLRIKTATSRSQLAKARKMLQQQIQLLDKMPVQL
ncbi:MAG TPA: sigma-70 family RNA polymerase sigma factor [Panacibacter sp.]|nr:sigma-70 family RNA polymerase sigma factor [Panacibacter sp.]